MTSRLSLRDMMKSLLPKGRAWALVPSGHFEQLMNGLGDSFEEIVDTLSGLASLRNPAKTEILSDLEKEYGIAISTSQLDEETRREVLAGKMFAAPGWGPDDLEARLTAAGFSNLNVYRNEDRVDPNYYLGGEWMCVCGNQNAVCGHVDAYCGKDGFDGVLLVNGPTHYAGGSDIEYEIPITDGHWHMVFFVGGEIQEPALGWVLIVDGDMEESDTGDWTAGPRSTIAKDAVTYAEGARSLKVTGADYYLKQDIGIDVRDDGNTAALRMYDNGDNVLRDVGPAGADGTNGTSYTNPALDPGTNSTDATAISFNGVDEGACADNAIIVDSAGSISCWVKVEGNSREDTFRLRPQASGYSNIPDDLLLDGESISSAVALKGEDATASQWTVDFAIGGSGADPTFDEICPGIGDTRVVFNGVKYYQALSAATGNPGTGDFWIGLIHKHTDESAVLVSKYTSAGDHLEIDVVSGGNALRASLNGTTITSSVTMVEGCWYYSVLVGDRDGNMRWYVNHTSGGTVDISGASAASPGSAAYLTIGARSGGSSPCSASIAYVEMFTGADMYVTDQIDDAVKRRAAYVYGVFPETYSSALNLPGVADLDTEEADTSSWSSTDAVLSKESGARTGGAGSNLLRITPDGVSTLALAQQAAKYTVGREYTLSGWARADGSTVAVPAVVAGDGATEVWSGSASATWQEFSVTFTAMGTAFELACSGSTSGSAWAEFDDLTLTVDGGIPVALGRASISALNKWDTAETESYIVWVGNNWVVVDEAKDENGVIESGVRIEIPNTNECLYGTDFSDATWTKSECAINTDTLTGVGELSFDAIVATGVEAGHYVAQDVTITPTSGEHGVSVIAKAGTTSGLKIVHEDGTNQHAYFDLANGTVGDIGAGLTGPHPASIEDLGDGFYRCYVSVIAQDATLEIRFYASDGATEGDEVFAGDASSDYLHLCGAMVEEDVHQALSLIETGAAPVSRDEDDLAFQGWEQTTGILRVRAKLDEPTPHAARYFASLDDGAAADNVQAQCTPDDNALEFSVVDGSAAQADITTDGDLDQIHTWFDVEVSWRADQFNVFIDETLDDQDDTSGTIPAAADLDYIRIGQAVSGGRLNGVISDFQLSEYGLIRPRGIVSVNDGAAEGWFVGYIPGVTDGTFKPVAGVEGLVRVVGSELDGTAWHHVGLAWEEDAPNFNYTLFADGVNEGEYLGAEDPTSCESIQIAWAPVVGYDETDTGTAYSVALGEVQIADVRHQAGGVPAGGWWEDSYTDGVPPYERALVHEISPVSFSGGGGSVYQMRDLVGGLTGDTPSTSQTPTQYITPYGVGVGNDDTIDDFVAEFGSCDFLGANSHTFIAVVKIDIDADQVLWANDPGAAPPGETVVELENTTGTGMYCTDDYHLNSQLATRYLIYTGSAWETIVLDGTITGSLDYMAVGDFAAGLDLAKKPFYIENKTAYRWFNTACPGGGQLNYTHDDTLYCFNYTTLSVYSTNGGSWTDLGAPDSSSGVVIHAACHHNGNLWCIGSSNRKVFELDEGTWYHRTTASVSSAEIHICCSHNGELWVVHSNSNVASWDGASWTDRGKVVSGSGSNERFLVSDGTDIFGARGSEVYKYSSGTTWVKVTDQATDAPTALAATSATLDDDGRVVWVDTGSDDGYMLVNDDVYPLQQLSFNAVNNKLEYTFKSSNYEECVATADFTPGEYNVLAVRREHIAAGAGRTEVTFFRDGEPLPGALSFTGAPVASEDELFLFADHDGANQFRGSVVAAKFFNDALSDSEIAAYSTRFYNKLITGPYATQAITGTDDGVRLRGFFLPDGEGGTYDPDWSAGYPLILYQDEEGGLWKPFRMYEEIAEDDWKAFDKTVDSFHGFRLYAKCFRTEGQFDVWFDDLNGGEDPGAAVIQPVQIPREKKDALEELILRRKPLHSWAILVVEYI